MILNIEWDNAGSLPRRSGSAEEGMRLARTSFLQDRPCSTNGHMRQHSTKGWLGVDCAEAERGGDVRLVELGR